MTHVSIGCIQFPYTWPAERSGRCGQYFAALTNLLLFLSQQPERSGFYKGASNVVVAEQQALAAGGAKRGGVSFQNGFYPHRGQAARTLKGPGVEPPATL
jgi:hypothetical protein